MAEFPIWFPTKDNQGFQYDVDFQYDVNLDEIKQYFISRRYYGKWISLFEFGIGSCRFDLIRVDCWKHRISGFEFKISKNDLMADNKWQNYLKYCNTFSFAMPMAITKEAKEKLPSNIGIMGFWKWKYKDELFVKDYHVDGEWLKKPRGKEISQETYIKVISLLLARAKFRAGDIF